MANAKGIFIPFHWIDEIFINDEGIYDEEYGKEVAMYLLQALKAKGTGEEIKEPEDRYIKAIVRGYLQQEETMQQKMNIFTNNKKGSLSDKELDDLLCQFCLEEKSGKEIVEILNTNYGCNYKDTSFIYRRPGWKKGQQLKSAEISKNSEKEKSAEISFSAENNKKSAEYFF